VKCILRGSALLFAVGVKPPLDGVWTGHDHLRNAMRRWPFASVSSSIARARASPKTHLAPRRACAATV
jgi:hypothetical protein